jgi:adenosylhomocysteine nucleosidase
VSDPTQTRIVALVSANAEWHATVQALEPARIETTPYGEAFTLTVAGERVLVLHGGWGKIAAAASAEYAVARYQPDLLINLGTCGGIAGRIARGETIVVTRTLAYDIEESMGDAAEAIRAFTTDLDVRWLDDVLPDARRTHLVSGDRDLRPADLEHLVQRYGAVAADWESAAIAYVARQRQTPLVIIRTVSDLVDGTHGETIGDLPRFAAAAHAIMRNLFDRLPGIVRAFRTAAQAAAPTSAA